MTPVVDARCDSYRDPRSESAMRTPTATETVRGLVARSGDEQGSPALVTVEDARSVASTLPRSYEAVVRDRLRLRVGRIVYVAFSHDETIMGFAFPKEERDALVASEPHKFLLPRQSELRYNWVCVRLDMIDHDELRELVVDAWRMCVPKKVAAEYDG
jgi:hypothetical protein